MTKEKIVQIIPLARKTEIHFFTGESEVASLVVHAWALTTARNVVPLVAHGQRLVPAGEAIEGAWVIASMPFDRRRADFISMSPDHPLRAATRSVPEN